MKIFVLLSGTFGASIKTCEDGIYRHPENCGAFYQCANGHQYEDQYCPDGLLFNESTNRCDWPENVNCGECTDGVHPHKTECNAYYQCAHGHRYPDQYCPDGLLFSKDLLVCDWPQNVDCNMQNTEPTTEAATTTIPATTATTTTTSTTTTTTTSTTTTTATEEVNTNVPCADGVHPHETECNAYYQCAHGHRYPTQYCPDGLLFNTELLVCDWPENVQCEMEPTTMETTTTRKIDGIIDGAKEMWNCIRSCMEDNKGSLAYLQCSRDCLPDSIIPQECEEDTKRAHETDCKKYYSCIYGIEVEQSCPFKQFYDTEKGKCNWEWKVNCQL